MKPDEDKSTSIRSRQKRTFQPPQITGHSPFFDEKFSDDDLSESTWGLSGTLVGSHHSFCEERVESEETKSGSGTDSFWMRLGPSEVVDSLMKGNWKLTGEGIDTDYSAIRVTAEVGGNQRSEEFIVCFGLVLVSLGLRIESIGR